MTNVIEEIDSSITDEETLLNAWREGLTCREYKTDHLINYKLLDKIFNELKEKVNTRPFILDKRGSRYFKFNFTVKYNLVHLNIETAKVLINILIKECGWKKIDLSYSQTTKKLEMVLYQYFDIDLFVEEDKVNKFIFSEGHDTFRLKYTYVKTIVKKLKIMSCLK